MSEEPKAPVQAKRAGPKRRDTRQGFEFRRPVVLAGIAGLVLIVALLAIIFIPNHSGLDPGGKGSLEKSMAAAGCTFKTYPDLGQGHVESFTAKVKYNSTPPTSGTHHVQPVIWGAYTSPVQQVQEVHNLEHGGVIIHYGNKVSAATRAKLTDFYNDSPNAMLLAPYPALGDKISVTSWTRLASCEKFDEAALAEFRSAYRGNGPERFRIGDLAPGT